MKSPWFLVALLLPLGAANASAASLAVEVEKLNAAAVACGLTESRLEAVAMHTLESYPLQPAAGSGGELTVRVSVTSRRNCVAQISVQMKAVAQPSASAESKRRTGEPVVVLCNKGGRYSAQKKVFPLEVESVVELSIKQCLGSLKY